VAKEITAKIKNRADTASNWTSANPILSKGEIGLETDTNKFKFGDGITAWNSLNYLDAEVIAHKADGTQHKKTVRFVVGTSTAGWTAADCDYLCDGTADQTEINAAITALPATGGEVVILDGTYNITAKINVAKNNVSIRGNGNATILKRMYDSSTGEGVITLTSRSGCKIANLQVDGNKTSYTSSNNYGIYLNTSSNNTVTGNTCNNNGTGIYLTSSSNNTVTGNTCNNNNSCGIYLGSSSSHNTVTGNTCYNNNSCGIYLYKASNNTVTGNTCNNNNSHGIYLGSSSNNNTVTGNTCNNNNSCGIYLYKASNNTVTGNTCIRGTGLTTDYTASQHTIQLSGTGNSYNLIAMNNCMGKAVTNGGGTGNTLVNNKFDAS
jgi:parallel beta-helix repeat protein